MNTYQYETPLIYYHLYDDISDLIATAMPA